VTATLVLAPDLTFTALADALTAIGWLSIPQKSSPIIPGEPEHALFERQSVRLAYSFNPVCRLRLLEVPLDLDHETVARLPVQGTDDVKSWLMSNDERTQLRGVLAAAHLPHPELLAGVEKLASHPRASIANAAQKSADSMRKALQKDDQARVVAQNAIAILKEQLTPLLLALGQDRDGSLAAQLRPRAEDYAKAFLPPHVDAARSAFEAIWAEAPRINTALPGSQLKLNIAPAGMLAYDNELSRHFPGGYRSVAPLLNPHRVWAAWKFIPPGKDAGMAYDGLVWLDDHWAWFPKPYRALAVHGGAPGRS
jgi:hypothetical protein